MYIQKNWKPNLGRCLYIQVQSSIRYNSQKVKATWQMNGILVGLSFSNKNTIDRVAYKQPKFISHGSEGWEA